MANNRKARVVQSQQVQEPEIDEIETAPESEDIEPAETEQVQETEVDEVVDISDDPALFDTPDFTEETIYEVLKKFTIIVGNGAVSGEKGQKVKLSKADKDTIAGLLKSGYIKVLK